MTVIPPKTPTRKEIAIVGTVSIFACAIVFGASWMQLSANFITAIYAAAIVLVAPLTSLYFDYKNPNTSDYVKNCNIKKMTAVVLIIGAAAVFTAMAVSLKWMPYYMLDEVLALIIIIIAPLISLYFDYCKNLATGNQVRMPRLATVILASVLGVLAIATTYVSVPSLPFSLIIVSLALAAVFVPPLISLYFDYKNPLIGVKNRKPSRTKAIITIAVGFMLILTIIASTFTRLLFDTTL